MGVGLALLVKGRFAEGVALLAELFVGLGLLVNIPIGADVFFTGSGTRCPSCRRPAGHVGVYVGDGYMVHSMGGRIRRDKVADIFHVTFTVRLPAFSVFTAGRESFGGAFLMVTVFLPMSWSFPVPMFTARRPGKAPKVA